MHVTIRLFAKLKEIAGASVLALDLPPGTTAAHALSAVFDEAPHIAALRDSLLFAINRTYVAADTCLRDGDELAFIPPVSGG